MMTVVSQNGVSRTYNTANHIMWASDQSGFHDLYTNKTGGNFIARIPATWAIELQRPCSVDLPTTEINPNMAARKALDSIRQVNPSLLRELKEVLANFNRQTGRWK